MGYIIKHKKKVFSASAQRMIETTRYYEYANRETAHRLADELRGNPMTILAVVYREDEDVK